MKHALLFFCLGLLPLRLCADSPEVSIKTEGDLRIIESNGLPDHATGDFPNAHNPNSISAQHYRFQMPLKPRKAGKSTPCAFQLWGVALNGVPFDPGTAEFWRNDPSLGWRYEAIGGSMDLGLDAANAHVQPSGAYHYHGIPAPLVEGKQGMVLLGYAADGFPIYNELCPPDPQDLKSGLKKMQPSWALKSGARPDGGPEGNYDGRFTADFEYVAGTGDLDENNGREGVTPEYPEGTYYYVLTSRFPYVPRSWAGTPDDSFKRRGPGGGPGSGRRRPGPGPQGPPPAGGPDDPI
jgi:hypothetical protein